MDATEELIKKVAARHHVALGRDDPILILQTLNEELQKENAKAQQTMLERMEENLEGLAMRWAEDSKQRAEQVLNAALSASAQVMERKMDAGAAETVGKVRREVETAIQRLEAPIAQARRMAMLNIAAAALSLAAACVVVWMFAFKA